MLKKALKPFIFFLLASTLASAQVYLSPFSRFGVGDIQSTSLIRNRAMGGASIAAMQSDQYSLANPATYGMVRSLALETGVTASFYDLKTSTQNFKSADYQIPYLSLALPLDTGRKFGLSAGLLPYSRQSLKTRYTSSEPINSEQHFISEGQLSKFYVGASFQIFHNFFLGANVGYIFGNSRITDSLIFPDSTFLYRMVRNTTNYTGGFMFDIGALYKIDLKRDHHIQLGLKANMPSKSKTQQYTDMISYFLGSTGDVPFDSVYSNSAKGFTYLPLQLGGGINISYSDSWQIFADVNYRQWSQFYSLDVDPGTYQNAIGFAVGGEWVPGVDISSGRFKKYLGRIRYRAGFSYSQMYFNLNGQTPTDKRVTLGMGFPVRVGKSYFSALDLSLELGQLGNVSQVGVQQRYAMISLGMHLFEPYWFRRPKID